jgi:hypothetical protein
MTYHKMLARALRFAAGVLLALLAVAALFAVPSLSAQAAEAAANASPTAVPSDATILEPKAIDVVKAASARLAAAKTMSFTAVASFEAPSKLGPPLVYTTRSDVLLQRPDKLRVVTPADGPASEFYYNGKTMTAYAPGPNLAAVADAPPTIDATLKKAFDTAAIYFPFTDIVVADPWAALGDGLQVAFYIGRSDVVGGVATDMVALANDEVFLQMWIGVDDKLPRRIRAQFKGDTLRLRHEVVLSDWKVDAATPPDAFTSAKAAAAGRMAFANPNPTTPPGVKPITERRDAAPKTPKSN